MRRGSLLALGFISQLVLALICSCQKALPPNVVALVNGDPITLEGFTSDLYQIAKGYHSPPTDQEEADFRQLKEALLQQAIEKRLILQEAQRLGVAVSDDELQEAYAYITRSYPQGGFEELMKDEQRRRQWKEGLEERLLIEKVINRVSLSPTVPDERTLKKFYKKHRAAFAHPEQVRARQIVVKNREDAEGILSRLKRGDPFDELARRHSIAPEAQQGGDLGYFSRGEMPEEFEVVFSLHPGEISDIVKSPYGYHIFQVVARREGAVPEFSEVKDQVMRMAIQEEEDRLFAAWIKKVKKRARIRINRALLESITPPPEQQGGKERS